MRLGVVGTGMIAQIVVPHLGEWDCPVAAICGTASTRDQVEGLCAAHGGQPFVDYAAMLAEADIDTVYVAVPNHLHFPFARQALEAGKNVIVEKPFASNASQVEALSALARARRLFLFEAITTLYLPNYARIRGILGRVGDVRIVTCNYSQYSHRYDAFRAGTVLPVGMRR